MPDPNLFLMGKAIGAGLACLGMAGAGIGLGNLFVPTTP